MGRALQTLAALARTTDQYCFSPVPARHSIYRSEPITRAETRTCFALRNARRHRPQRDATSYENSGAVIMIGARKETSTNDGASRRIAVRGKS
jgi:hypothetical protein